LEFERQSEFDACATEPADEFVSKEEESVVWSALENIPENYREVLVLYYRQGQSIGEVATSLGIGNDAARQRLSRGREMLRSRVSNLIEGVLDRTNPTRTFTSRVMAAIASAGIAGSTSTAKASMAFNTSTATSAATLAKVVSGGSALGVLGGLLGAACGMLGAWIGTWFPAQMAPTETERQLLLERGKTAMKLNWLFLVAILFVTGGMVALPSAWIWWLITLIAMQAIFMIAIGVYSMRTQRLVRSLRKELTPEENPNQSKIATRRRDNAKDRPQVYGRRYTSKLRFLGLPLFDIQIPDPPRFDEVQNENEKENEVPRAKGWLAIGKSATGFIAVGGKPVGVIAIGGIATGGIAIGGVAFGLLSFGGLALGGLAIGGAALGGLAIGGAALGYDAVGGLAIAWQSATGGGAIAWHAATGGGALANDFAVGGSAYANEANTELAKQVINEKCHLWFISKDGWFMHTQWLVTPCVFAFVGVVLWASRFLYTTDPPTDQDTSDGGVLKP